MRYFGWHSGRQLPTRGGNDILEAAGLQVWTCRAGSGEESEGDDAFLFEVCAQWFPSLASAQMHRIQVHGMNDRMVAARQCCIGSACPCCSTDFVSRARALRHLVHGASACVAICGSGRLPNFSPEEVAAPDSLDRGVGCRPPTEGDPHQCRPAMSAACGPGPHPGGMRWRT